MSSTDDDVHTGHRSSPADVGLLILRIAVGACMLQAGLIKAFDFDTVVTFMESGGWRMPGLCAAMVTATETAGGIALILGVLTPLAACGVVAAMIDAWAVNVSGAAFWSDPFNVPFLAAFAAAALLFTGAGRLSLDARVFDRPRWPGAMAVALLLVAVAAGVATWVLLNGTNPLHLTKPAS
jgi:putative oxidoreductase